MTRWQDLLQRNDNEYEDFKIIAIELIEFLTFPCGTVQAWTLPHGRCHDSR